jgi:hypothetical protein
MDMKSATDAMSEKSTACQLTQSYRSGFRDGRASSKLMEVDI